MMTLVNMDGDGLLILPTHRLVHGLADCRAEVLTQKLQAVGAVVKTLPLDPRNPESLLAALAAAPSGEAFTSFVAVLREASGAACVLQITLDGGARKIALPERTERRRQLDMAVLHEGIFAGMLGIDAAAVQAGQHVRYQRDAMEAIAAVLRGEAQAAFLVNPVTMEQLRENTFAGEVMPQKSTDFYPKLLSGLAIYAMDEAAAAQPQGDALQESGS